MRFRDVFHVHVGGVTKAELLRRLAQIPVSLNDHARVLFAEAGFTTTSEPREVRLVAVSLPEIGLPAGGTYEDILARAADAGLEPCALEIAPHLRLQYLDQSEGPHLTVASVKLRSDATLPNGLYLRRREDGLWLRGYRASADHIYLPDFTRFVFVQAEHGASIEGPGGPSA